MTFDTEEIQARMSTSRGRILPLHEADRTDYPKDAQRPVPTELTRLRDDPDHKGLVGSERTRWPRRRCAG